MEANQLYHERVQWIDICKGIGIILIVFGHQQGPASLNAYSYIPYAFHIPLFFFLSGIVFIPQKYTHFGHFLKNRIISIVIPYFFVALASYFIRIHEHNTMPPLQDEIVSILGGNMFLNYWYLISTNIVLWFSPVYLLSR